MNLSLFLSKKQNPKLFSSKEQNIQKKVVSCPVEPPDPLLLLQWTPHLFYLSKNINFFLCLLLSSTIKKCVFLAFLSFPFQVFRCVVVAVVCQLPMHQVPSFSLRLLSLSLSFFFWTNQKTSPICKVNIN